MRSLLASAVVWIAELSIPLLASATDYYVSPSGSGTTCSSGSPCALGYVNGIVVGGDRVILQSGTYTGVAIDPAVGGSAGSRITYMGAVGSPTAAIVDGIALGGYYNCTTCAVSKGDYVSVKWLKSIGSVAITGELWGPSSPATTRYWADYDSLIGITIDNSAAELMVTGHRAVVSGLVMTGSKFYNQSAVPDGGSYSPALQYAQHNKFIDCAITLAPATSSNIVVFRQTLNDTIERCRISVTSVDGVTGQARMFGMYNVKGSRFVDTYYEAENNEDECGFAFDMRDSTRHNVFVRDTILVQDGSAPVTSVYLSDSGTLSETVRYNTFDACVFKYDDRTGADTYNNAATWQNGVNGDIVQNCTFISGADRAALGIVRALEDSCVFRHNTLFTSGQQVLRVDASTAESGTRFVQNVLYGQTAPGSAHYQALSFYDASFAVSDSNLYFSVGGDSAFAVYNGGTTKPPSTYSTRTYWRTPRFTDSTYSIADNSKPNVVPGTGSFAVSCMWPDNYVGAKYADLLAPSGTEPGFCIGRTTIALGWNAPGDDCDYGTAYGYDFRYTTAGAITEANFASATALTTDPPDVAGTLQCAEMADLSSCTKYYFGFKTRDDVGNWSVLTTDSATTDCAGGEGCYCAGFRFVADPRRNQEEAGAGQLVLAMDAPRPNPTATRATLGFVLPGPSAVTLRVFDAQGRVVRSLLSGIMMPAGEHTLEWDLVDTSGQRIRAGVYFARLEVGAVVLKRALVILGR